MAIKIISDGSVDIQKEILDRFGIKIVPLNVHFGDQQYKTGIDIDSKTFFEKMRESEELPKSSSPSPNDFLEAYQEVEKEDDILVIALSSGLSSTYESAVMAKDMFLEENPGRNIEVVDSETTSAGLALSLYETAKFVESGASFEQAVRKAEELRENTHTVFILDTLENVIKGGRLDRVRGTIAKTLNIKLMMHETEGKIDVLEKIRGNKKAIRRFVDQIGEYGKDFEGKVLALAHSNCEERARNLIEQIKEKYPFKEIILSEVGPLIGTYAGEGGLIMAYEKK